MLEEQLLPSFGYCKSSVFECASDSYIFTKNTLDSDTIVIVPSANCASCFNHFFGYTPKLFTPKKFLEFLCKSISDKNKLIPDVLTKILFKNYFFDDSDESCVNLFEFNKLCKDLNKDDANNLTKWLDSNNFVCAEKIFEFYDNKNLFEKVILYGNFDCGIFCNFFNFVKKISNFLHIITHTPTDLEFLKKISNEFKFFNKKSNKTDIVVKSFECFSEEIFEIKTKIQTAENKSIAIIEPFFNTALSNSLNAVIKSNPINRSNSLCDVFNSFFKWMIDRDCTSFLSFLKKLDEHDLRKFNITIEEELINALNRCLTTDYAVLWNYLIAEKELHELTIYQPVFFDKEAKFSDFFTVTKNCLSQFFKNFFEQNYFFETLQINITAENFISAMKAVILEEKYQQVATTNALPIICDIKTAASFPFDEVILPFFNNNIWPAKNKSFFNFHSINEQKNFLEKLFNLNAKIFVSFSKKSEILEKIEISDAFYEIFDKLPELDHKKIDYNFNFNELFLKIPRKINKDNSLRLPSECIDFSCKAWERFKLAPLQTFFEKILKLNSTNVFIINKIKNKRIGELSHEWVLEKNKKPKFIKTWITEIFINYEKENSFLNKIYTLADKQRYYLINQILNKSLTAAITFANACEVFLEENLFSEYDLKKSTNVKYAGRIDLLIKHSTTKFTVIDFKNSKNLLLTQSQLLNGHGLQLLLYANQLNAIGADDVTVTVISADGSSHSCKFNEIFDKIFPVINWVNEVSTSGIYENIPKEDEDSLPIIINFQ